MQSGEVLSPRTTPIQHGARALDGTLGQVLGGQRPAIRPGSGFVVSKPFGMAILDVALIDAVHRVALDLGPGHSLTLH